MGCWAAFSFRPQLRRPGVAGRQDWPPDVAASNNAIERADTAATSESQPFEYHLGRRTIRRDQLRGIEVGEANLDPLIWITSLADAQTVSVSVADIAHGPDEGDAWSRWKPAFAWVGEGRHRCADGHRGASNQERSHAQAAFFSAPLLFFLVSNARANLFHFAMAARFSGI